MSSSTAPASPSSASESVSASSTPENRGPATSSNLYLVTFLATLFLLLFVSCAIVLRSYILRRRYQRRLDEAMAAGMLLAPRTQGSKRKRFGVKPKLFDTWLAGGGGVTWDHIKPLSAQPVFVKRKYKDGPPKRISVVPDLYHATDFEDLITNGIRPPSPSGSQTTPGDQPTALRLRVRNLWSRSRTRTRSAVTQNLDPDADPDAEGGLTDTEVAPVANGTTVGTSAPAGTAAAKTTTGYKVRVEMLQVSVLIAMPSQNRAIRKNAVLDRVGRGDIEEEEDDEDDSENVLPELVFGVTRVHYRQPKAGKSVSSTPATAPAQQKPQTMSVVPEEDEGL